MTLHIRLRDGEQVIVNGAVLKASGRAELLVENRVSILRGREVMTPKEATTPVRRLYLACMMAYVDEPRRREHQDDLVALLGELISAFAHPAAHAACLDFARLVATNDYYRALATCRELMDYEAVVLARPIEEAA